MPLVYVHSAICETYSVLRYSIDLWSIGGGVALVDGHSPICETDLVWWYSIDLWSIGGGGWNLFGVVVFHRSMINWRRGTGHLRVHLILKYENVKMTLYSTPLGHQMPLAGVQLI